MKKILSVFWCMVLLLFIHNTARSQQTLISVTSSGSADWNAYVHVPSDYNDPGNANTYYPTIIFFPGVGEVGTNASLVIANGPGAYIAQTTNPWNGNVVVDGTTVKFIVISLQPAQIYPIVTQMNGKIQKLKQLYRIDNNRLYLTGLSHGGWCSTTFVRGDNSSGPSSPYASQVAAVVNVEGVTPDTPTTRWDNYAALGGRLACFEQRLDYRAMQTDVNRMNSVSTNSAIYTQTTFGDEKHCCWEQFYGGYGATPVNFMLDGVSQNIYQWMARQSLNQQVMPSITSPLTATGNIGTPFTYTITATGNTTSYTATNLPAGLTVNTSTGVISGTPTAQGTFSVSISAANSSASIYKTLTLTISPASPPVITSLLTATGNVGTAFTYAITATGSVTSYSATNLPAGLTVNTTTGVISGTPTAAGTTSVTISATNAAGTNSKTLSLAVNPPAGEKIYASIKYTSPSATNPWYNNITGVTTNNLLNSNNQATAVDLEFLTTAWNTWYDGPQTGNNSGVYPDAVLKDYYYFGIFDAPQTVSFRYKDLIPGQKYNLILYAGSVFNMAGVTDNGTTIYTIGGVSKSLYVQNNTANTVTFTNVEADGSGYITVAMSKASGTPVGYLNAAVLEKVLTSANQFPVANAGSDQAIQLPGTVTLTGSGTDADGTIASYAWTKLSGPAGGTITSPSSASTTVTGLPAGTYQFQLTVTDNLGGTNTDIVNVTLYGERIFMSIKYTDSPAAGAPWNNVTGVTTNNLLNSNGQATAVDLEFVTTVWNTWYNGPQTGNNSGVYPDAVLKDYYYFGIFGAPETVSFRYKDLVPGQKYNVTLYAGSVFNMGGVTDNGTTVYTINGVSQSLYVQNNTANTVTFSNVVADGSGYITVAMSKASGTPVGYINAAVLEKTNIAPTSNAGATRVITLPTSTTTLTGSGTDIDGTIATYAWTQVSGPSTATIVSSSSASTGASALVQGTYVFKLTVTDDQGATGSDTMSILVNAASTAQRILIDVGPNVSPTGPQDTSGKYWNNMTDARAGVQVLNAVTTTNAATTVDLEVVNRIDGTFNTGGIGLNNATTGAVVSDYPVTATGDYAFAHPSTTAGSWKFTGLDNTKQYTIKFWGRKTDTYGSTRIIQIKRASESTWQEYDAADNADYNRKAEFTFSGFTEMSFDIRVKTGNDFGYISVVDISSVTPGGRPVSNPAAAITKAGEEAVTNTATVYPNPVKNTFTLDVNSKALGKTQVMIFNEAMQVVKKLSLNKTTTAFKSSISIAELSKGTYFVQVRTGNNNSMIKIVKQ